MAKRPNRPNKNRSGRPGGFGKPGRPRGRKFGQGGGQGGGRAGGGSRGKAGQGGQRRFSRGAAQPTEGGGSPPESFEGDAAPRPAKRFQRAGGRPAGHGERAGRGERSGKGERTGKGERAGRGGKSGSGGRGGASGRGAGGGRPGRGERPGGAGRAGGAGRGAESGRAAGAGRGKFSKASRRPATSAGEGEAFDTGERPRGARPAGGKRFAKKGSPGVRPPGKFRGPKPGSKYGANYGGKGGDRKPYGKSRRGSGGRDADVDIASAGQAGPERLQKVLAAAGLGSRRECEELITEGRVEVDRKVVTELGTKVDPLEQEIRVDGVALTSPKRVYYAVNKPPGVVCTNRDQSGRTRVIDLIKTDQRLFTVGRLDRTSEGLILVTNDGRLANLLTHPRYGVEKTYAALVEGLPSQRALDQLREGVHLAEGLAKAEEVRVKRRHPRTTELIIVLTEGRNREVRRMLARIGHKVLTLRRIAVGPLSLGNLPLGAHRRLTVEEIAGLEAAVMGNKRKSRPSSAKSERGPRDRKAESRIPESDMLPLDESAEQMDLEDDEDDEGEPVSAGTRDVWADQESLADLLPPRAGDGGPDEELDEEELDEEDFGEEDFGEDDFEDEDLEDEELEDDELEGAELEGEDDDEDAGEHDESFVGDDSAGDGEVSDADDILISDETLGPDENAHPGSIIGDKKTDEDADWK